MESTEKEEMNKLRWYHQIELSPGVFTPGYEWNSLWRPMKEVLNEIDFRGKRVLDVASWDGMWAFEAEKRGAAYVLATDLLSARWSDESLGLETFRFARRILKSNVDFASCSVYHLDNLKQKFDIVICFGLLYHLRHPTLALDQCRSVLVAGGQCLIETALLLDESKARVELDSLQIYPSDPTTWCAHSDDAMKIALRSAYLEPEFFKETLRQDEVLKIGRGLWIGRAFEGPHPQHSFPYEGLSDFFQPNPKLIRGRDIPGMATGHTSEELT